MTPLSGRIIDTIDLTGEVAQAVNVEPSVASRVISMFEEGYTVPFIARYRKEVTGGMEPAVLHRLKEKMVDCKMLIEKIDKSFKYFDKQGLMTNELSDQLLKCRTTDEVKMITEPLKPKGPRTLAGKARAVNLEPIAMEVLCSRASVDMYHRAPEEARKAFPTPAKLEEAVSHIIAEIFSKDLEIIRKAEELCTKYVPTLQTTRKNACSKSSKVSKVSSESEMTIDDDGSSSSKASESRQPGVQGRVGKDDLVTFKNYLNFSRPVTSLHAHQVLAINRAADRDIITVRIIISPRVESDIRQMVVEKYFPSVSRSHWEFIQASFTDAWKRLIEPHLIRRIRSLLTTKAQDASLDVFSENLRRLLMTAPLRDSSRATSSLQTGVISSASGAPGDRLPVVGLDPGWRHGCKWAACDPHGDVLATGILWPPTTSNFQGNKSYPIGGMRAENNGLPYLTAAMQRHGIQTIALGNGQGSRQTGQWLSELIKLGHFNPLDVRYAVVSESGASVYSASELASAELPQLDVSFRGAVSIARRLQDPLYELVKVEPKHLGVGMYQHDLPERRLVAAVNDVMEECISFVGVDVNAAPLHILSRVAGLSAAKAKAIIDYRSKIGAFRTRTDLKKVKGIGAVTFAQCAGFIRIRPSFSVNKLDGSKDVEMISVSSDEEAADDLCKPGTKRKRPTSSACSKPKRKQSRLASDPNSYNPLDQTAVHPDSYEVATSLIASLGCCLTDVGKPKMRQIASELIHSPNRDDRLKPFCTEAFGLHTLRDILDALSRPLDFDERQDYFLPLFHSSALCITDLHRGMRVSGRVENVTTFGAFCDIGVAQDAFIPKCAFPQQLPGQPGAQCNLKLGDRITGFVQEVNYNQGRIALDRIQILPTNTPT
ncbi:unnamed protein product [Calicophoron daubneyi]